MPLLLLAWLGCAALAVEPVAPPADKPAAVQPADVQLKALAKEQRRRREAFRKKQKQEAADFEKTLAGKDEAEAAKLRAEHVAQAKEERKAFHKRLKAERDALRR